MDDTKQVQTNNAVADQVNGLSVSVEVSTTVGMLNHKKPRIPCSQQKCSDCQLYGHKTMMSRKCENHHKYLQLQQ